ncbi:MAG: S41 family peptidase, partial [Cyclobacteriaceae bacterium]
NVYVLIDGFSFSTCADVATVLHHHQLATFIGEETGGGYDGNTSGNSKSLVLPNSGIRINLPMWKYTTANIGHPYYGRGVIPDFPVEQTRQELIENKDPVMKKALRLLQHP